MARKNYKRKHRKIVRDMYDGKPINDKEAVSMRNIDIVAEKEGLDEEKLLKKAFYFMVFMWLCFLIVSAPVLGVNETNQSGFLSYDFENESAFDWFMLFYIIVLGIIVAGYFIGQSVLYYFGILMLFVLGFVLFTNSYVLTGFLSLMTSVLLAFMPTD